jgi:hypothetical protein
VIGVEGFAGSSVHVEHRGETVARVNAGWVFTKSAGCKVPHFVAHESRPKPRGGLMARRSQQVGVLARPIAGALASGMSG